MTTFIINGQERELQYRVNGIDISGDFIGNTSHGMERDEDGRYLATEADFEWWQDCISNHQDLDAKIAIYKERFVSDKVSEIVEYWSDGDYEQGPINIIWGLEQVFGGIK